MVEFKVVSIIVPCYNQGKFLNECLESVQNQIFQDWECIIINDGSFDDTGDVAKIWVERDNRFKYIYQENRGVAAARNVGVENAIGEWLLPLDGDDKIADNYIVLASKYFDDEKLKLITCDAYKFGEIDEKWILKNFRREDLAKENIIHNTSFYRKRDWIEIGGYDEELHFGYEDWDFWIALLKDKGNVIKINQILFFYRIKHISRNKDLITKGYLNVTLKHIEKKHYDFFAKHLDSWVLSYQKGNILEKLIDRNNKRFLNKITNRLYQIINCEKK